MQLRFLSNEDCDILLQWRNDPVTRSMSRNQDEVSADQHRRWFAQALDNPDMILLMGIKDGQRIGLIRFDQQEDRWETSINLNPAERGKGLGKTLLRQGMEHFWSVYPMQRLSAWVRAENLVSRKIFEACGFKLIASGPDHLYFVALNT